MGKLEVWGRGKMEEGERGGGKGSGGKYIAHSIQTIKMREKKIEKKSGDLNASSRLRKDP